MFQVKFNITTTKKKYHQSIGISKELIIWWDRPFFRKDKIKDFKDFSVKVISQSFNGVETIKNSNENEALLQSEECLHGSWNFP